MNVAVLVTLDSKGEEAQFVCEALSRAGVQPWLLDLSLRPHKVKGALVSGGDLAEFGGSSWQELSGLDRNQAAELMITGGEKILLKWLNEGGISGVIGVGGANGSSMACSLMRSLPFLFPKAMVSPVAATGAVQWYVAESDIVMFPSIGDISMNRIICGVMENAASAIASMARAWDTKRRSQEQGPPLIGVTSFGGTSGCVSRVTERLQTAGYEVILFHASGPGGRALERLSRSGELAGVIDITTHELTDLLVDGVYSAGEGRLRSAGKAGLPQVVCPGALDHSNFWTGMVPERFAGRRFFQYNAQNILMRTNSEEFNVLGRMIAERLNEAQGSVAVLIPMRGFSEHTKRMMQDLNGLETELWYQPEMDSAFVKSLQTHLKNGRLELLDLHINDPQFADACVEAFLQMFQDQEGSSQY